MQEQKEKTGPLLADLSDQEAAALCRELREELIRDVSRTGGHLASNLGAVELTVAIHRVFDTSRDRLVFDVGHQCYIHKMLTGRREEMAGLRQYGGIAGFPKPGESVHDAFIAGHASNSVAVAVGMVQARAALGQDYQVATLIGDGALTGGLAYEGLSNGGQCGQQLLVILNDNGMSIDRNVGAVARHLAQQRLKPQYLSFKQGYRRFMGATWLGRKIYRMTHSVKKALKQSLLPCSMFENMGFTYLGPVNGHDLPELTKTLRYAASLKEPVLLHVKTVKGKGFAPAERNPDAFHGVSPFDPVTEGQNVEIRGKTLPYVSRGGLKLEKAMQLWPIGLHGAVCADIGASTGGFTDCMLQNGAQKVYAVDVGYNQLDYRLRTHPQVVCMERTNARYLTREQIPDPLNFFSVDVSFISLNLILPALRPLMQETGEGVCLVKPQFEAGKDKVGKKGVVRDPAVHLEVLEHFLEHAAHAGFSVKDITFSPIRGPEGNIEYLGYLSVRQGPAYSGDLSALVSASHGELKGE